MRWSVFLIDRSISTRFSCDPDMYRHVMLAPSVQSTPIVFFCVGCVQVCFLVVIGRRCAVGSYFHDERAAPSWELCEWWRASIRDSVHLPLQFLGAFLDNWRFRWDCPLPFPDLLSGMRRISVVR